MELYFEHEKRKSKKKWLIGGILVVLLVFVASFCFFMRDVSGDGKEVSVTINSGESITETAQKLKDKKLIASKWGFAIYAKAKGCNVKHGTYLLKRGSSKKEIVEYFEKGATDHTVTFTIPEGYSVEMIAKRLEEKKICNKEDFLKAVSTKDGYSNEWLKDIPEDKDKKYILQGYLYPDTYNVYKDSSAKQIVQKMLDTFEAKYNEAKKETNYKGKRTMDEIVILSSVVEREASAKEERPMIAGVMENRLKIHMRLQVDPTVLYTTTNGMYDAKKVYYKDLETDTKYNTYRIKGLPVGPICNPGVESMKAVMKPTEHEYLYYRTDGSGNDTHVFTKTFEEHVKEGNK